MRSQRGATIIIRWRVNVIFMTIVVVVASLQIYLGSVHVRVDSLKEMLSNPLSHPNVSNATLRKDQDCIFRNSPLYRSVYVYPSPGEPEWSADILSEAGQGFSADFRYPWQIIEEQTRQTQVFHFRLKDARAIQYTTELLVREILVHPNSCLRTFDPSQASLFFVPYMVSMEWHNGSQYPKSFETSVYGQAIIDILDSHTYHGWEKAWGLSSDFWKRRGGADHVLVMSEGCHGLSHPRSLAGNDVFIKAQKQMTPPIIIYKDTSRTFLEAYPSCAAKNLVVPAPNPDGRWFNGKVDHMAHIIAENASFSESPAALPQDPSHRPLAYYYKAGNHGSCRQLRQQLEKDFECSPTGRYLRRQRTVLPKMYHFPHAFRHATFCPCPGGDTPNSKRYFDAIMAGCIPLILSQDFVWPYSNDVPGSRPLVKESDFSVRLNSSDFWPTEFESRDGSNRKDCLVSVPVLTHQQHRKRIQDFIESIPESEIRRLQSSLTKAASVFSYYLRSTDIPDHPLLERTLPNGPAAHALVEALADRRYGNRWPACQTEIRRNNPANDNVHVFRC